MKYRYAIIVGRTKNGAPFNVQRMHHVDGEYFYSGHGKYCKTPEESLKWISEDVNTLPDGSAIEVGIIQTLPYLSNQYYETL